MATTLTKPKRPAKAAATLDGSATLGLRFADYRMAIAKMKDGFAFASLRRAQSKLGLSVGQMQGLLRMPPATFLRRRKAGRLTEAESERLLRVARVWEQALDLFEGDELAARSWMKAPIPSLSMQRPIDLAETEVGAREVETIIHRAAHGVFT